MSTKITTAASLKLNKELWIFDNIINFISQFHVYIKYF